MKRLLITGGAGFIGSHLVRGALERGFEVVVLDDLSTGRLSNLSEVREQITFIQGSVAVPADVDAALSAGGGCDGVLHQAAMPSVPKSIAHPLETHQANVLGTLCLLDGSRRRGVSRVVYAGSSSAYGDQPGELKSEELMPRPLSPYAVQKLSGEQYCKVYNDLFGLQTVVLRYFNVFGPRQDPNSQYAAVIPAFITCLLEGRSPTIHGDGEQSRDFTFVRNVVAANFAALEAPNSACGQVYNAACGEKTTLNELVALLNGICGTQITPEFGPSRAGDVRVSCASTLKAEQGLGYRASVPLGTGLELTVAWLREESRHVAKGVA
ncbi:MAG: SDR family oxidoreductase [Myxococcales bacterium]|nr:SDR family oxidoreductase [Myxococcales bacterium]